ncbi:MAG: fumarylacetoacetate hydrolase family protein [Gammaproteobacteria bacterium]|nr:fumarylacetoacetate hydrolase family protein [Gammaproteobacteria bacterium]
MFAPDHYPSVAIIGSGQRFGVHRIYCVGRNYAAHAREMGNNPDRDPPFFFTKPDDAVVANGAAVPYPPRTANLHHEVELVVAIGAMGRNVSPADAHTLVFGYAVGNDLTRRDLQQAAREERRPWDTSKGFDHSAPLTGIHPVPDGAPPLASGAIWLKVNGEQRQSADLADMIWSVAEVIAELSALYTLQPGDLIFTGTPAGVGPVQRGDQLEAGIAGFETLVNMIV